jgi:hypothetical protein
MTVRTTRAQIAAFDAQIVSGKVKVETARANLGYTRIIAPTSGTVLAVVAQEGQTVNAVQSAPTIVVLGDISTMTVKAKISEADVLRVKTGQDVFFSVLGEPDTRFPGKISFVEPAPDTLKTQNMSSSSTSTSSSSPPPRPRSTTTRVRGAESAGSPADLDDGAGHRRGRQGDRRRHRTLDRDPPPAGRNLARSPRMPRASRPSARSRSGSTTRSSPRSPQG